MEVEVTNPSVRKLPIYAALGVPEVWVWRNGEITVRRRDEAGELRVVERSAALTDFPLAFAAEIVARRTSAPYYELVAEFRAAVRDAVTH